MRKYKPTAWVYEDGGGVCAQHCRNKNQALKVMQEAVDEYQELEDDEMEDRIVVTLDEITLAYAYGHRNCDGVSIGEPICWGCGEGCSGIGRKVLVFTW